MHAAVQRILRFGIKRTLPDQAAEGRLDMRARATEAVVEVEVAESGVEIVAPEQGDDAPAQPDAFRLSRRAGYRLCGFGASGSLPPLWAAAAEVRAARHSTASR